MQHSNRKIYIKRILGTALFVAIFLIINSMLNILLEFPETESQKMLRGYTWQSDLDTIIVGNSITTMIDTQVLDEKTGFRSYNMGTPSQTFAISKSIIEMAASQNPIKRVYIVTGYDSFEKDDIPTFENIFNKTKNAPKPLPLRKWRELKRKFVRATSPEVAPTTESITLWFNWVDNCVGDLKSLKNNFNIRVLGFFQGIRPKDGYAFDLDKKTFPQIEPIYSSEEFELYDSDMKLLDSMNIAEGTLDKASLKRLDEICNYCNDNNIELTYFISPHQTGYKERYEGNYEKVDEFLNAFFAHRGIKYYNLDNDPEIHEKLPDEYFYDWEHVEKDYIPDATNVFVEKIIN